MWGSVRLVALLGAAFILPAMGQVVLVDDPEGDVRLSMPDGRFRLPSGDQFRYVDLVEAGIWSEGQEEITFYVRPADISEDSEHPVPYGDPIYEIRFRHGLQGYRVLIQLFLENAGTAAASGGASPQTFAQLQEEVETEVYEPLADAVAEVDIGAGVVRAIVPRAPILDHNQAPLSIDAKLTGFSATARSMGWFGVPLFTGTTAALVLGPPMAYDRAPDSYFDDTEYTTTAGPLLHKGNLVAGSSDPVRWTNGEATTFVYRIRLTNLQAGDLGVTMSYAGTQPNWQVAFSDRFIVPGDSAINVTFHVAIPFNHQHNALHPFEVHFTTPDNAHTATARLGVFWPPIPQPAGHHNELWFHSQQRPTTNPFDPQNEVHAWVSAANAQADVRDEMLPVPPDVVRPPDQAGRMEAAWRMLLEPSLRMGLDFDLTKTGQGTILMDFPVLVQNPELELSIRHYDRRFIIPRVTTISHTTVSLGADASGLTEFTLPEIVLREKADLIRYVEAADLEFNVTLRGTIPSVGFVHLEEATPRLIVDGSGMTLPMFEYHDPLDATFFTDASATVEIGELGSAREVNAGKKIVYNMYLQYDGVFESDFTVELSGHQTWASVLGAERFTMEPGDRREVAIAVAPPADATPGTYDTTVRLVSVTNAAVSAGATLRTTVVPGDAIEDESELAEEKSQQLAPPPPDKGFPWLWVLLPLLVIVAAGAAIWRFKPEWVRR